MSAPESHASIDGFQSHEIDFVVFVHVVGNADFGDLVDPVHARIRARNTTTRWCLVVLVVAGNGRTDGMTSEPRVWYRYVGTRTEVFDVAQVATGLAMVQHEPGERLPGVVLVQTAEPADERQARHDDAHERDQVQSFLCASGVIGFSLGIVVHLPNQGQVRSKDRLGRTKHGRRTEYDGS